MKTYKLTLLSTTSLFAFLLFLIPVMNIKAQVVVNLYADSSGCATVVNTSESQLPIYFGNNTPNTISCIWNFGDPASGAANILTANAPDYFSTIGLHSYYTAGTYTVTLTVHTSNGTGSASKIIVIHPTPISSFTEAQVSGNTYQFTSNSTGSVSGYSWHFGDEHFQQYKDTATGTISHTYANTYPYTNYYYPSLIVRTGFGCADTSYGKMISTGIEELTNNKAFRIYPNPSSDGLYFLELTGTADETVSFEVLNAAGQIIFRQKNKEKHIRLDLSSEADGHYFLVLHQGSNTYQHKLLLAR